jgi:lysophospholipase L1-like esterase/mannose-6-phosphate isomerase-like protein (cupin superfamily)
MRRIAAGLLALVAGGAGAQALAPPVQRVFVVGDSTACDYEPARAPRTGWGQVFGEWFDRGVDVRNRAQNGRSARSFVEQGWLYGVAREIGPGDLLLIQFGHNDEKIDDPARYNDPVAAFPLWLMQYVEMARAVGATPVLITPVARRRFAGDRAVDAHGPYAEAVRALARRESVASIDLARLSLEWLAALGPDASKRYYLHVPEQNLADNTHFHRRGALAIACLVAGELRREGLIAPARYVRDADCAVGAAPAVDAGSAIVREADVGRTQPGPHGGAGPTTAYPFFADAPDLKFVLRKRVLHRDAGIGLHRHDKDEIYYVVSGRGAYVLDGVEREVGPGDAMLTRPGSVHALNQLGDDDLVVLIGYTRP